MSEDGIEMFEGELNSLVNVRNAIAHGENSRVIRDDAKMNQYIELVTNLIDLVLLKQVQFVQEGAYLK